MKECERVVKEKNLDKNAENPFTLSFGEKPFQYIERAFDIDSLVRDMTSDPPVSRSFIISGVRGSGKTVTLTSVMSRAESLDDWIVVELNPEDDMREALAAKLYSNAKLKHLFLEKEFGFSFQGLSFSIKGKNPILNIDDLLSKMFASLKKAGKKVLVCVDEVSSSPNMRRFILSFQILIRQGCELVFLRTGLYENISKLENEKNPAFLLRAPKIQLTALSLPSIASSYMRTLGVGKAKAEELAKATKGYAFAFQLLGYLLFRSENDKRFLLSFPSNESADTKEVLANSKLSKDSFSTYRSRLLKKGVISSLGWGKLMLSLPRFREFMDGRVTFDF